tara:strand:- start:759 stop:1853 length:1095 start_codon:yes stop_codon:yes gene_type:complete
VAQFTDQNRYNRTLRYPLKAPVASKDEMVGDDQAGYTELIDYVRIRRKRVEYTDKDAKAYGGTSMPQKGTKPVYHNSIVYLAMPTTVSAAYQPTYRQVNLGVGGAAALNALGSKSFDSLAASIQSAAKAMLPEFAASAIAQGANSISGFFGVQGNLDANALQGLTTGRVFNPYTEQIFSQMNFRNHSFSFKLLARNAKEAQEIKQIIDYLKVGAHPQVTGNDGFQDLSQILTSDKGRDYGFKAEGDGFDARAGVTDLVKKEGGPAGSRFFKIPDHYQLSFVRMNPNSNQFVTPSQAEVDGQATNLHFRMADTVCSGVSVNYTPDNQYTSFKSIRGDLISVPAVVLNLQFTEIKLLSQKDILRGY